MGPSWVAGCPEGQYIVSTQDHKRCWCLPCHAAAALRGEGITKHAPPPAADHGRRHSSRDKEFWERLATEPRPARSDSSRHAQAAAEPAAGAADGSDADSLTEALAVDSHGGQPWGSKKHWGGKPVPDTALPRQQLSPPRAAQTCWCPPGRRCLVRDIGSCTAGRLTSSSMQLGCVCASLTAAGLRRNTHASTPPELLAGLLLGAAVVLRRGHVQPWQPS